ncbi:TPA: RND transporter, partial [Klebsiella pneumoniae]|nr:RND transporter [Klebsiella pneumoniae]HEC0088913.1 RND transporter [Klebsiella pneumoniae]HED9580162.1 RND transporter [Klebsiella pneumoniae]
EVNGMDTYSNNGGYTSSLPDRSGADEALEGSSLSTQQGVGSGQSDSALAGRDWHSPANLNDGAAASSMSLLDKP